jgi:glycosyltransferase involved in cell wall biosynthesis
MTKARPVETSVDLPATEPEGSPPFPRVCVVNASLPPEYGGAEIAAYRYAERLSARGHGVTLMAPHPRNPSHEPIPRWVEPIDAAGGNALQRGRLAALGRLLTPARHLWPRLLARRRDFDLVHIFNSAPLFNLMAVPMARLLRKPVILEMSLLGSDDPVRLQTRDPARRDPFFPRPPVRFVLFRLADAYVSKSPPLTRAYLDAGMPAERLSEIPYAVDLDVFRRPSLEEKRRLRARLDIPEGDVVVLFVGGMTPRKRVHHLIEAFRHVAVEHPRARLLVVGPADKYERSYVDALHSEAERSEAPDRIVFVHGMVENVPDYMRAADIFCLPTSREGLPIAVLEAMASGLAVVASRIPEIASSQIDDGTHGLLVPVGDVPTLTKALETVVGDRELREKLGEAAYRRAESKFSVEAVHARYRELYGRLLGERGVAQP